MNPIIPSDVPYVIGFGVVAILFLWFMGWLGRRGLSNSYWRAGTSALMFVYFAYLTAQKLVDRNWPAAIFPAVMSAGVAFAFWSDRRRESRPKRVH